MMHASSAPASGPSSGRLKYANPRDLPSYPSPGLPPDGAAASAAASLGWANQKPIEHWKPDKTASAFAAAVLAKDYKMAPAWQPTSNSDGAKAALLAVGSANAALNKTTTPKNPHDGWGSSAATQAFNTNRANSTRQVHPSSSSKSLQSQKSLAAARGAMAAGTRPRAISTPVSPPTRESYPLESMAASSALSGATLAHQASLRSKSFSENAGAVPITTMTRNMFTSNPPVKPEVDERQNQEKLHQTAVEMARKMYSQQKKMVDQAKETHSQDSSAPKPFVNLQEAAYKQAQERLAKLHNEHQKNRDFNEYYGNTTPSRRRFSFTSRLRRRSSSDGDLDDRQQSEKIRDQMSSFSNKLSQVDEKKRQKDRDALLAAAQRNVKARLQGMDHKVMMETGQVNPTMLSDWEVKAHHAATVNHESRTENKGKVDIGGGKFMNADEVNAIASKRIQPILDDINEKAAIERERLAALKLEEEAKKAEIEKEKARDREIKEITKKLRDQEKQEEKEKRAEVKAAMVEQKRQAKEEKRLPKPDATSATEGDTHEDESRVKETQDQSSAERRAHTGITTDVGHSRRKSDDSPTSPTAKVKGWIKNRFSRGKSISDNERHSDLRKSFMGGAALRDVNHSSMSLDNRSTSIRDVALAGRINGPDTRDRDSSRDSHGVSMISSSDSASDITPPRPLGDVAIARNSQSPSRDSRFREMMDH